MATFWEIDAVSVDHMFTLYFDYLFLFISFFDFEGWIRVLISSAPGLCKRLPLIFYTNLWDSSCNILFFTLASFFYLFGSHKFLLFLS